MARAKKVTRTITTTEVKALCMNIEEQTPETREFVLSSTYKSDDAILKQLASVIGDSNIKPVAITEKKEVETLYGMSEQDFIAHAEKLDPTTRK